MILTIGDTAPQFSLPDQHGIVHSLADYRGKWVLVYFYPKDDTTGCTTEACSIRDNYAVFQKKGMVVLGISKDSVKSHQKFAQKYTLPFILLADEEKKVVETYGVWRKKKFMGKEYMGIARTSFLINPDGKVVKIYEGVDPKTHASDILRDAEVLMGNTI